ncbi:DUF6527 family protein [Sphingomonas bacterium]|uniref:DUF6527 family protein n=1 Tax=Sphingomonas bacterium TaxID=1895847 RepID=UPI0015768E76|nr:DUF6527 family protein [Sphingomonas bacterium]
MTMPARKVHLLGNASYRDEAEAMLAAPGDAALVERGVLRSLVLRCPDGCGETLVVNFDPRAGKAWRLYQRRGAVSVYPSVWLDGGCESHFIIWKDRILWCDVFEEGNEEPDYDPAIEPLVLDALPADRFVDPATIAQELDLIVWDAGKALRRLVARGDAREGVGSLKGTFGRIPQDV